MTVTLLRHGRADFDVVDRFIGHGRDLAPLTAAGIADAERAADVLVATPVDAIVSSPMTRALQTATIVGRRLDRDVLVELDLHEWMPDAEQRWHGPEVPAAAYEALRAAGGAWPTSTTPGWEPLASVHARASAAIERHREHEHLLVVCHSVVIEALTGVVGCGHGETVTLG